VLGTTTTKQLLLGLARHEHVGLGLDHEQRAAVEGRLLGEHPVRLGLEQRERVGLDHGDRSRLRVRGELGLDDTVGGVALGGEDHGSTAGDEQRQGDQGRESHGGFV
jgi:hypothetical protein